MKISLRPIRSIAASVLRAADWRALITLIGWIAVVAGTARLALPAAMKRFGEAMLEKPFMIAAPGALMAIIGGYLSWHGYLV